MHNIHVDCTFDDVRGYFLGRHTAHLQLQCAGFSGQFTRNMCHLFLPFIDKHPNASEIS